MAAKVASQQDGRASRLIVADRRRVVLVTATTVVLLVVGVWVVRAPVLAVGLSLVVLLLAGPRDLTSRSYLYACVLALAVPTGYAVERLLPGVKTGIGSSTVSVPVLLVIAVSGVVVVRDFSPEFRRGSEGTSEREVLLACALWLAACAGGVILGIARNGAGESLGDAQTYLLYAICLAPLLSKESLGGISSDSVVDLVAFGLGLYSLFVLALVASDSLHSQVFSGYGVARSRAGFSTGSLVIIFAPVVLAALRTDRSGWLRRGLHTLALLLMGVSVIVSQSRSLVVLLVMGLGAYVLYTYAKAKGKQRARTIRTTLIVLAAVALVVLATDLSGTVADFIGRGPVSTLDPSYQTRLVTYQAAWSDLLANGGLLVGRGMGSLVYTLTGWGAAASRARFVDNAALTIILKVGVVGLAAYLAFAVALWRFAVRVARQGSSIARAISIALPFFYVYAGVASAQLVASANVPVGLALVVLLLESEARAHAPTHVLPGSAAHVA